ncbi:MAG: hypothetical protein R3E98_17535 [Gemmatimonadota bacterium]|nr:hypothetical protein [Gemmatimonadota bacterium]
MEQLPAKIYSKSDLETARTKGQVMGWVQGAGAVLAVGVVLKLLGWIPTLLVVGGVVYLLYRLLGGGTKDGGEP